MSTAALARAADVNGSAATIGATSGVPPQHSGLACGLLTPPPDPLTHGVMGEFVTGACVCALTPIEAVRVELQTRPGDEARQQMAGIIATDIDSALRSGPISREELMEPADINNVGIIGVHGSNGGESSESPVGRDARWGRETCSKTRNMLK